MVGTASDLAGAAPEDRLPSTTGDGSQRDSVAADVQEERGKGTVSFSRGSAAVYR